MPADSHSAETATPKRDDDSPWKACGSCLGAARQRQPTKRACASGTGPLASRWWMCLPALDVWSLDELIGYYVLYRKVNLNAEGDRHPLEAFGLYAVATRYPEGLARSHVLQPTAWDGVYELPWGGHQVRLIVLNRIEKHPRNAPWELFASERDRMRQGLEHYRARPTSAKQPGYWELLEHLY